MLPEDKFLRSWDKAMIWQRYCDFFDLSLKEFMEIQEHLLLEEIELVAQSPLGERIMKGAKPKTVEEFRKLVPLTTYDDYEPYIGNCQEDALAAKPYCWARTSGRGGSPKWVPFVKQAVDCFGRLGIAVNILACASRKGEIRVGSGIRYMHNIPPRPYLTGIGTMAAAQQFTLRAIPPLEQCEGWPFEKKIEEGFKMALRTGVDVLCSLTPVLIRMSERFTESSEKTRFSWGMLHPMIAMRLIRALLKSKKEKRRLLPKDLWPVKGLICYGTETSIYREQLIRDWGKEPLEIYGCTEVGLIGVQAWNKKGITFFPLSCFLEFIPKEEWLKSRENKDYQPSTVLLGEVEAGKSYEVVITSFYGMPFLRYRLGDLVRITDLQDEEAGIRLPQMVFECRTDDLIDMAGFARLDEKTIWQAIVNTRIRCEDWTARKEHHLGQPILRIYIEPKESIDTEEAQHLIHHQLRAINSDYRDVEDMLGMRPVKVTALPRGSFQRYYEEKQKAGADLAHLKPSHMNASDNDIQQLACLAEGQQEE